MSSDPALGASPSAREIHAPQPARQSPSPMPAAAVWVLNAALLLSIAGIVYLIGSRNIVFGSAAGKWVYPYYPFVFRWQPIVVGLGLSIALIALLHASLRYVERYQWGVLAIWLAAGMAGQMLLRGFDPFPLWSFVRSDICNAFYNVSKTYSVPYLLGNYRAIGSALGGHVGPNMPGKIVFYRLIRLVTENPQQLGVSIVALSDLGGILVYFVASEIYGSRAIGLCSLALYLFIPAQIAFIPLLNIVSVLPVLASLLLLIRFLASRRAATGLVLGALLYAALFFDPLPLSLGLFFPALIARSSMAGQTRVADIVKLMALSVGGFLIVHAAMMIAFRFDVIDAFLAASAYAREFYRQRARPYSVWLWADLAEFSLSAGLLPALLCLVYAATSAIEAVRSRGGVPGETGPRRRSPNPLMLLTLIVTLAILDLLGVTRGEVARLWIFIMPFVQIVAAAFCLEECSRWTIDIVLAGMIIQSAITVAMVAFVVP